MNNQPEETKLLPLDINVSVDGGKYRIIAEPMMKNFRALRNGEEWRPLTGDNLIYFLAIELQELRDKQPSPTWVKDAAEEILENGRVQDLYPNSPVPTQQVIEQILTRHAKT